jgi:hypothetical protein
MLVLRLWYCNIRLFVPKTLFYADFRVGPYEYSHHPHGGLTSLGTAFYLTSSGEVNPPCELGCAEIHGGLPPLARRRVWLGFGLPRRATKNTVDYVDGIFSASLYLARVRQCADHQYQSVMKYTILAYRLTLKTVLAAKKTRPLYAHHFDSSICRARAQSWLPGLKALRHWETHPH